MVQTNIFISYGRKDGRDLALQLRDDLAGMGYSIWLDTDEIAGGASWSRKIEEAIEHCHVTLALMSHSSYESQWCRAEQLRSLRKGKRVIPLLVQADAEIPLQLEHLNYLNFSDAAQYDRMLRDLLSDISAGQAFQQPVVPDEISSPSPFRRPRRRARKRTTPGEKRSASSFRQIIRELRGEPWLGSRSW